MSQLAPTPAPKALPRSPRRIVLAALGVLCVGLALAGVVVPGLPTTIFLIAASYLFTKSCPWLEERLVRSRVFRPYLRYVDAAEPLPRAVRVRVLLLMWAAVAASLALLAARGALGLPLGSVILAAAVVGTGFVWSFRRDGRSASAGSRTRAGVFSEPS